MYSENQIRHLFGDESLTYLKNKHRGGVSNEKGNTYENFYATYTIALLAPSVIENGTKISFHSQVLSFVDDLVIFYEDENKLHHHQLKNSPQISWGRESKSISDDFKKQEELNRSLSISSKMTLVVADEPLKKRLAASCPEEIRGFTQAVYFPHAKNLMQIVTKVPEFYEAIQYLCASETPEPDKIDCVAKVILGAWVADDKSNTSVLDVLTKAQSASPSFIRSFEDTPSLDPEVVDILSKIADFSYNLAKGFLHWQFGNNIDQGTIPYRVGHPDFNRFQERIKTSKPKTFEEFEVLL
jgi:hypothetical protein